MRCSRIQDSEELVTPCPRSTQPVSGGPHSQTHLLAPDSTMWSLSLSFYFSILQEKHMRKKKKAFLFINLTQFRKLAEKNRYIPECESWKTPHSGPEQGRHFSGLLGWPICCSLPRMCCQYCLPHAVA